MLSGLLIGVASLQAPELQTAWHSPDAILFVEMPDVPRMLAAYEHAPWVQMMRDETVRNGFKAVLDELHLDLDHALHTALGELGIPPDGPMRSMDDVVAHLKTVRAASVSLGLAESSPGEFAATFSKVTEAAHEIGRLASTLEEYAQQHEGTWPADLEAVQVPAELKTDPWGKAYRYEPTGTSHVKSLGADGAPAGTGPAADIDEHFDLNTWLGAELQRRGNATAVVEFLDQPHAREAIEALASFTTAETSADAPSLSLAGHPAELRRFKIEQVGGWSLLADARVVVGIGAVQPDEVVQRVSAGKPSLSSSAWLKRLDAQLPPPTGATVVRGMSNGAAIQGPLKTFLENSGNGASLQVVAASSQSAAWRMQLDGQRFLSDIVSLRTGDAPSWMDALGGSPVPAGLARLVPEDAIAVLLTTIDGKKLHEELLSLMGFAGEQTPDLAGKLAELEKRHDFNLQHDVFESIGPGAAAYLLPISSVASLPGAAIVLDVRDAAAFERGLKGLTAAIEESAGGAVKVKFKKYKEAPMWTFSFEEEDSGGMNPFAISPTIVIVEGHAIITLNSVRAGKEVKRALGEEGAPHRLLSLEKPPPPQATTIGYMDWGALFDGLYTTGKSALSLLGANANLPFDVNKVSAALPEAKALTRFYQPTILWSRPIEGGTHTHWEASFGPETWASLIVFGVEIGFAARDMFEGGNGVAAHDEVAPDAASTTVAATKATLEYLATRIAVFQLDQGRAPKTLGELSQATKNYPSGFLDGKPLPTDGWSRAFAYELVAEGARYRLWSLGPDGVDAKGGGDDIVAP